MGNSIAHILLRYPRVATSILAAVLMYGCIYGLRELARRAGVTPGRLTTILGELEKAGAVRIRQLPDGRLEICPGDNV